MGSGSSFREEKNLLTFAGNRTMIPRSHSLYPSHYTNYAIPVCNSGKIKRNSILLLLLLLLLLCIKALKHVCLKKPISAKYTVHLLGIYRKYCKYGFYPVFASDNDQKSIY